MLPNPIDCWLLCCYHLFMTCYITNFTNGQISCWSTSDHGYDWDWSSTSCPQPATTPPKNWALSLPRPKKRKDSSKGWGSGTFAGLLFSNLVSLLLGAGLGVWIYRRWSRPKFLIFSPLCKCIDSRVIISKYFFLRACGMYQQIADILPHVHVSTHLSCFYTENEMFIQIFTKTYDHSSTPFSGPPAPSRLWSDP